MDVDASGAKAPVIDESLYSRQLYVMGHEAQMRMGASSVLVVGLDGLGVEIAKNIVLAGVKSVSLHDDAPAAFLDLAAQFYLSEGDLGQPRARVSAPKLAELNPYVRVEHHSGELSESFLQQFRVVVVVNATLAEATRINAICHAHGIAFISTEARGVFGSVFCDFGDEFVVSDRDGEQPVSCLVASISNASPALVTVNDDARHQLETGDVVTFREVDGFPFLNDCAPRRVTVTGPYTFTLDPLDAADAERFASAPAPSAGGYVTAVKQPLTLRFRPLADALAAPGEFLATDFAKLGRPELLHVAFQALDAFRAAHGGRLPTPGDRADGDAVLALALARNAEARRAGGFAVDALESEEAVRVVRALASGAAGVVAPTAAFLGGVVAQEALKACSGKFTPIHQFLYFDAAESLPEAAFEGDAAEFAPTGDRYDAQRAVFGRALQRELQALSLFLVGAGAIGCEMLKNWAMMGVATAGDGAVIHVTDMDSIEKSNLNRQFLFRAADVQQPKSTVAARAVRGMNPGVRVRAYEARVGAESEAQFNDAFFESLAGVCTALDNVEARLYMDQRCLFYGLPMFESGTLGTKGNTQVVVPHATEHYGASRDPPEKSIPICTLKNFPNAIEHTLQWARDWFEGAFFQAPADANQFLADPAAFAAQLAAQPNTRLETLERLAATLVRERPATFDDCVAWARRQFEELFSNQLKQLLHNFPLDQRTSAGAPFWSGPKRPPTPLAFDARDPLHLDFVEAVAASRAQAFGLARRDREYVRQAVARVEVAPFAPRDGVKIAASDAELKDDAGAGAAGGDVDAAAERLLRELPGGAAAAAAARLSPLEFDKDDDAHMAVVVATSNLRARAYKIPEADLHQSRLIAGKIIPAIATTTALVTGLVCFELLKAVQKKPLAALKNGFVNLALPLFAFSEPVAPKATVTTLRGEPFRWTAWDRLEVPRGELTLRGFLSWFEQEYEAEVTMLSYGVTILYAMYSQKSRAKERMALTLPQLVETVTKKPLDASLQYLILEVCAMDADGEDVELPYLRYHLRP